MPQWYAENGQYLTTKFFGMKANRYLHDHNISAGDPGQGRRQELPQRRAEPECVPAQADSSRTRSSLADAELSADAVHVLRTRRGRGRGGHVPRRHRPPLHRQAGVPAGGRDAHPPVRRLRGEHHLRPRRRGRLAHGVRRAAAFEKAGVGTEDVDIIQLQDTDAGAEIIHMAESGLCADGDQERMLADGATEIPARCRSTPTAA